MVDIINPTIVVYSPVPNSKNNGLESWIVASIYDTIETGSGINNNTIIATVNGEYAFKNGVLQSGFDGYYISNPDQNTIEIQFKRIAPYNYLESINVSISARDLTGNPASTNVFYFITEDNVPPSIINISPANNSGYVGTSQPITYTVKTTPLETPIDINTLYTSISGLEVDGYGNLILDGYGNPIEIEYIGTNEVGQLVYDQRQVSITQTADQLGYDIRIMPFKIYPLSSKITVKIKISDQAGNLETETFSFTTSDTSAPRLLNPYPLPDSISNPLGSIVSFTLADKIGTFSGSGIRESSIKVTIDGKKVIEAGYPQEGFSATISTNSAVNGYDIVITSTALFSPRKTINVAVEVSDNNSNVLSTNYVFTTEDVVSPLLVFMSPKEGHVLGLPTNTAIIMDIQSEITIGEIDISSVRITIDDIAIFEDNSFTVGYSGLAIATTEKTLTITTTKNIPFGLGQTYRVDGYVSDVFGNSTHQTIQFTTTTEIGLKSNAFPTPGIYDKTQTSNFPPVGSFLTVVLTSNNNVASIAYTTDGSDPTIDLNYLPVGTTQIYTQPINISNSSGGIIRFFAFDQGLGLIERINDAVYVFTNCPEYEVWDDFALRDGLEYTNQVKLKDITFINNTTLITAVNQKTGSADYIHDLGRESFIDSLEFNTSGLTRFRVRIADSQQQLPSSPWLNKLEKLVDNQLLNLYGSTRIQTSSTTNNNNLIVQGWSNFGTSFEDEGYGIINQPLFNSFTVNADMKLTPNYDQIVGAKSFIRLFDDTYNLEIQQIVSKSSTSPNSLVNTNSLVGETPIVTINNIQVDGYNWLTDGYDGYVNMVQPPVDRLESLTLIKTLSKVIEDGYVLEQGTTDVFGIESFTPSVYESFNYDSEIHYSSSRAPYIRYRRVESDLRTSFIMPVLGKSLDITTSKLMSENLNTQTDKYAPAEKNGIFELSLKLDPGDYNFRFYVKTNGQFRTVSNPYLFKTKQDLSLVQAGDNLIIDNISYQIASIVKSIDGYYIFEFEKNFPQTIAAITEWTITTTSTSIVGTEPIIVENSSNAILGQDSNGVVGNIILKETTQVIFKYTSSTAEGVDIVGTFNDFLPNQNSLIEQLDSTEISKAFDGLNNTSYKNNYQDFHKLTITPELPMIVDKIRFKTGVLDGYNQRARLLIDDVPMSINNYKAKKADQSLANYLNKVDVYTSSSDDYIEWSFVEIGSKINRALRKSIGLATRFESYNNISREHIEIDVFTLPSLPQMVADFYTPLDTYTIKIQNKSEFLADSNITNVRYGISSTLSGIPTAVGSIKDDGLINNFIYTNVISHYYDNNNNNNNLIVTKIYVEKPYLFQVNDFVIIFKTGYDLIRAQIISINNQTGLLELNKEVYNTGVITKDYKIVEDQNNFNATIGVPKFKIVFSGIIKDLTIGTNQTIVTMQDILDTDTQGFLGGRFDYPTLKQSAKILNARRYKKQENTEIINLIEVTIDKVITSTYSDLGATIETYDSEEIVTDYVVSKIDGSIICKNQSELCLGEDVRIAFKINPVTYQQPNQMFEIDTQSNVDQVKILIQPNIYHVTLKEIDEFDITIFNGVDSLAPDQVSFLVNGRYSITQNLADARIIDGYTSGLYDVNFPETGQIIQFNCKVKDFILDGYQIETFDSLQIEFSSQTKYIVGEIKANVNTSVINSRCRIVLDDKELYISNLSISEASFSRYALQVDKGNILIYFDGNCILRRPILFVNPKLQFGAAGKVTDDQIYAEFKNMSVDQYYDTSPAKIQKVGRFIEIEGTVVL